MTPKTPLSASRIKTLKGCSWQYWCKYVLGIPDKTNSGALKGSIIHLVFECLSNKRHIKHFKSIIRNRDVFSCAPIKRLIVKHLNKVKLNNQESIKDVCSMILNGLRNDFYGTKLGTPDLDLTELEFDIICTVEGRSYRVKGFIDKVFIYGDMAVIRDYKSSKKTFSGSDLTDNLQDYIYSLAVRHLYPQVKHIRVEFVFLKDGVIDEHKGPSEGISLVMDTKVAQEIKGFEFELHEIQKYADTFDKKTAISKFAAFQGFPEDGGFGGCLLCGFSKEKGQLKKDGSPMWDCSYKWGLDYYSLVDEAGKQIKSSMDKAELESLKKDKQKIKRIKYAGCPAHRKAE